MSRIPLIEMPPTFGRIDVEVLEEIGHLYATDFDNLRRTYVPGVEQTARHHPALWDLAQNLFTYMRDDLSVDPNSISYDFDVRPVMPDKSQRDINWHMDDPYDERHAEGAIIASSALPTEFIVPGRDYKDFMKEQTGSSEALTEKLAFAPYINELISDSVLDIYVPEPGEVVLLTNQIHQSPYNRTGDVVQRVWMRGWLERLRGIDR